MNNNKLKDRIKLIIGISILLIIFSSVFIIFYINMDNIYYALNGTGEINQNAEPLDNKNKSGSNEIAEPREYLENIVFLGDSIMVGFSGYREYIKIDGEEVLKDITVIAASGYGVRHAISDVAENSVNLTYEDKPMKPEDIISKRNEKYVFVCLGLNDLGHMSVDEYIKIYRKLLDNIQAKSPGKIIVILSVTPMVAGKQGGPMNKDVINDANKLLRELAEEYNIPFIDWAASIRDENNALYNKFSSDAYCHLNVEAYNRLAEYLMNNRVG